MRTCSRTRSVKSQTTQRTYSILTQVIFTVILSPRPLSLRLVSTIQGPSSRPHLVFEHLHFANSRTSKPLDPDAKAGELTVGSSVVMSKARTRTRSVNPQATLSGNLPSHFHSQRTFTLDISSSSPLQNTGDHVKNNSNYQFVGIA